MRGLRRAATAGLSLFLLPACGAVDPPPPPPESFSTTTRLLTRGVSDSPFRIGQLHRGSTARHGVWVKGGERFAAPARVPEGGVLAFTVQTVSGQGTRFEVDLQPVAAGQDRHSLVTGAAPGAFERHRVDLAPWAGQEVTLGFLAEGPAADTIFFGEPAVFAPSASPRRVVLVFVDTLRPDHLGFYGYERDTSPRLDALARTAAVFEVARAPAPWTVPSARSALSGRKPEAWAEAPNLAERLAEHGFATLATTSNAFLAPNFGMARGFGEYQTHSKAQAEDAVDRVLAQLASHRDRDVLVLVHFMDPHLPYREPEAYQGLFDSSEPALRGATFERDDLLALDPADPGFERERQRIVDRYDQTIRYLDDQLARLLEEIGPDATVALFSDHGEEFWEHGGAEHGHSLFEEVLRVPLLVRDRALPPGRHRAPVSLLDIAPTVLELLGIPDPGSEGVSLVGLARGAPDADQALALRPEVFGRMLYGGERWSVRRADRKWSTWAGRQILVDLTADPEEQEDLSTRPDAALPGYAKLLSQTLGREVLGVWRVLLRLPPSGQETLVRISHPSGIADAWVQPDPLGRRFGSRLVKSDGTVELIQPAGAVASPALTLLPGSAAADPRGLHVAIQSGAERLEGRVEGSSPAFGGGASPPLLEIGDGTRGAQVLWALSPRPVETRGLLIEGPMRDALRELGYID